MERPPRLHHRHVEGPAVVGDQDRRLGPRPFADRANQGPLGGKAGEHELADQEAAVLAGQRAAHEERDRAGPAGEARRLQIQVQDAGPRRVGRGRVAGDQRDVVRRHARVPQLQRAVPVGGRVVALDDQRPAERPVDLLRPGQRRRHRRVDQRQAVVADRLVGQLAGARRSGAGTGRRRAGALHQRAQAIERATMSRTRDAQHDSRAGHPASRRCSSLTYHRYAPSSRLAIRAPRHDSCSESLIRTLERHLALVDGRRRCSRHRDAAREPLEQVERDALAPRPDLADRPDARRTAALAVAAGDENRRSPRAGDPARRTAAR